MGCYLGKPNTTKESENDEGKNIRLGCCSMQGWRVNQEDAHNAIIDYAPNVSLFGVYDGHGGAEVAKWIAQNLPKHLKGEITDFDAKMGERIQEAFIAIDAMIASDPVIKELFAIAGKDIPDRVVDRDEIRNELDELNEEAELSHEDLLKKYNINASQFKDQKEEIANLFLNELAKMQSAEADEEDEEEEDEEEDEGPKPKSLTERQAQLKAELEKEENNGALIAEADSDASSSSSDDDDEEAGKPGMPLSMADEEYCGRDSGCTCILALYNRQLKRILAANIGDSRCIVSRAGKAMELSEDHKPEDDIELKRITKAGGFLTDDGRVKGGLNLSRAFGDHQYKDNSALELKDQMITAYPDIRHYDVTDEDEFILLACDGIWNVMTNQEAVDFVRDRLEKDTKISDILEELFDQCISPDTSGDGSGCDNMTGIIVQLNARCKVSKRPISIDNDSTEDSNNGKRTKVE